MIWMVLVRSRSQCIVLVSAGIAVLGTQNYLKQLKISFDGTRVLVPGKVNVILFCLTVALILRF